MSVKVAAYKKIPPGEDYGCTVLEVREWAEDLADLRIEFGTHRSFRFNPRCTNRPKIQGIVVASIAIDCQLKPSLFFYPIPHSQYPEPLKKVFLEQVLGDLKIWVNERLGKSVSQIIGHETLLIELYRGRFKTHQLRYL